MFQCLTICCNFSLCIMCKDAYTCSLSILATYNSGLPCSNRSFGQVVWSTMCMVWPHKATCLSCAKQSTSRDMRDYLGPACFSFLWAKATWEASGGTLGKGAWWRLRATDQEPSLVYPVKKQDQLQQWWKGESKSGMITVRRTCNSCTQLNVRHSHLGARLQCRM